MKFNCVLYELDEIQIFKRTFVRIIYCMLVLQKGVQQRIFCKVFLPLFIVTSWDMTISFFDEPLDSNKTFQVNQKFNKIVTLFPSFVNF